MHHLASLPAPGFHSLHLPLPPPCAATARTPFNGLSRFNSMASAQLTPPAAFRQTHSFAPAGQPHQGGLSFPAAALGRGWGGAAAGGAGGREGGEAGQGSDATLSPEGLSPMAKGIIGGLGISVR